MVFEIECINPKTGQHRTVRIELTELERARAKLSPCWMSAVQDLARPSIPKNFMPIGNRVRAASHIL